MDELRTVLEDNLNSEFLLAVLSNPRRADGPNKVRIRPVRHKDRHVYQFEAFCGTQVFHQNLEKEEACGKMSEYLSGIDNVHYGTDPDGRIQKMIYDGCMKESGVLPVVVIADSFGRVVFYSQGYNTSLSEQLRTVIDQL